MHYASFMLILVHYDTFRVIWPWAPGWCVYVNYLLYSGPIPLWVRGSRIGPTCPPACHKRRLIGGDTNLNWILQNKFLFFIFFCSFVYFNFLRILFMVCIYFIVFGYLFLYSLLLYDLVSFYDLILSFCLCTDSV